MCKKLLVVGLTNYPAMDMRPMRVVPIIWDRETRLNIIPMHDVIENRPGVYSVEDADMVEERYKNGGAYKLPNPIEMGEDDVLIQTYDKLVVLTKLGSWDETLASFIAREKKEAIKAAFKALEAGDEKKALRLMYYASRCD